MWSMQKASWFRSAAHPLLRLRAVHTWQICCRGPKVGFHIAEICAVARCAEHPLYLLKGELIDPGLDLIDQGLEEKLA